jgi:hypothetical protein
MDRKKIEDFRRKYKEIVGLLQKEKFDEMHSKMNNLVDEIQEKKAM